MPLLWRYLILSFARTFSLSILSFILILLVSRFKEISRFGAQCLDLEKTATFVLYQIPLILPLAIPISVLVSTFLLSSKSSQANELTVLRSSGIATKSILTPIIFCACLLCFVNFSISANVTSKCRRLSKQLLSNETSQNPLLVLQKQSSLSSKKSFIKIHSDTEKPQTKDFLMIFANKKSERLSLIHAKKLKTRESFLTGENIAIISQIPSVEKESFDSLIIENQAYTSTDADQISSAIKKKAPSIDTTSLDFPMLRLDMDTSSKKENKALIEIASRISISFASLTLCFLGLIFGIQTSRYGQKKQLIYCVSLCIFFLISYLFAKKTQSPFLTFLILLQSHLVVWYFSLKRLSQIEKGVN